MSLDRHNLSTEQDTVLVEDDSMVTSSVRTNEMISHDEMIFILRILMYGVTPFISILGVIGNIFSIIILFKHGLHKCSNILLVSLAVTDLTFLIAFNSVPKIIYEVVGVEFAFNYSRRVSLTLFIFYNVFNTLDYAMGYISLTMPMFITIERLVAVYFPFKFNLIITPKRTWCAVVILYVFWYTIVIYMGFWFTFTFTFDASYNMSLGRMERSDLYKSTESSVGVGQDIIAYTSMKIPPIFTLVGCIFISVKVRIASSQRRKMTQATGNSKEPSSNRTTKMLLAVCVIYMLTCAVLSLPTYIPQYMYYSLLSDAPSNLGRIMYQVMNIAVCINSSANFVVYVVMNNNFRDTYKSLFVCLNQKK